jgi:hypothetical protein
VAAMFLNKVLLFNALCGLLEPMVRLGSQPWPRMPEDLRSVLEYSSSI